MNIQGPSTYRIDFPFLLFLLLATPPLEGQEGSLAHPSGDPPFLIVSETIEGEIDEVDPIVETEILKNHHTEAPIRGKAYQVQIEEAGPYSIDLRSHTFDAYLVLRDQAGAVIAEDDDGLLGSHARIAVELESGGIYQVAACALHGDVGPFTIVLHPGLPEQLSPVERARREIADSQEKVRFLEALRGSDHPEVADALTLLGLDLASHGLYSEARSSYEKSIRIMEKALGSDHVRVADPLNNLALLLKEKGLYPEARSLYERSLRIKEKALGSDHPNVGVTLYNMAVVLKHQGNYSEARPLYERSLEIFEAALGPDHPNVATTLNSLGSFLELQGNYAEARPLYERSIGIYEEALALGHPAVATPLNNLAGLLVAQGRYAEARPLHERALGIRERAFGSDHPEVAESLFNLANLLVSQGSLSEARRLYERALEIWEKVLGPDHPDVATALGSLASLLQSQGFLSEARPLLERSLGINEKALGSEHPRVASSLHSLATLFLAQGRLSDARPLYEKSLRIREETLGPDHPEVAQSLNDLAILFDAQGLWSEAQPLFERSLEIYEEVLGPNHPDVATLLNNLAALLQSQGRYAEARPLLERCCGLIKDALGPGDRRVAVILGNLAVLESDSGQGGRALSLIRESLFSRELELDSSLAAQTESERMRFAATVQSSLETYLSLARGLIHPDEVTSVVLKWKGRVARSLFVDGKSHFASLSPEERGIIDELLLVQKDLSNALYDREVADRVTHGRQLEELRKQRKKLELSLVRLREGRGEKKRAVRWEAGEHAEAVKSSLPPGSVVVNFLVHRVYYPAEWNERKLVAQGRWAKPRVSAFVIHSGKSETVWLDLGEAMVLEAATRDFLEELISRRGLALKDETDDLAQTTAATDRLREILWDPIREEIGDSELVIISPDLFLGTLPFETLQEIDGSYLLETRSFVYLQDLVSLANPEQKRESPSSPRLFAVGGIDYGRSGKIDPALLQEQHGTQAETRGGLPPRWSRLSLTGQEADGIVGLFEETRREDDEGEDGAFTLLMRRNATEEAVKHHLQRHTLVHLATHGYFQPEGLPSAWKKAREEVKRNRDGALLANAEEKITGLLPGLLSGLVFAGANAKPESGRDNGLLTAEEVTFLDLSRCELVVLSACETGLGRPEGGEGMIGLRRSFRQAGARTVISSLWQVRDDSTQELMERFYENLWLKKMGKLEALRQAQLWMLRRNREEDGEGLPSTWGAFVLDGDWK